MVDPNVLFVASYIFLNKLFLLRLYEKISSEIYFGLLLGGSSFCSNDSFTSTLHIFIISIRQRNILCLQTMLYFYLLYYCWSLPIIFCVLKFGNKGLRDSEVLDFVVSQKVLHLIVELQKTGLIFSVQY